MEMTPARLECLRMVALAGGEMSHDDERLSRFCDDASTLTTPDVFNQCHDAGWLVSRHDDRIDASHVYITDNGRQAIARAHT